MHLYLIVHIRLNVVFIQLFINTYQHAFFKIIKYELDDKKTYELRQFCSKFEIFHFNSSNIDSPQHL